MTKNEIITTAKCCIVDNCVSCPFAGHGNCITDFMNHILEYMKTEPALSANSTSSEVVSKDTGSILHLDDTTLLDICQEELEAISEIALDDYPNEYLTGYIVALKKNIERLRGEHND